MIGQYAADHSYPGRSWFGGVFMQRRHRPRGRVGEHAGSNSLFSNTTVSAGLHRWVMPPWLEDACKLISTAAKGWIKKTSSPIKSACVV